MSRKVGDEEIRLALCCCSSSLTHWLYRVPVANTKQPANLLGFVELRLHRLPPLAFPLKLAAQCGPARLLVNELLLQLRHLLCRGIHLLHNNATNRRWRLAPFVRGKEAFRPSVMPSLTADDGRSTRTRGGREKERTRLDQTQRICKAAKGRVCYWSECQFPPPGALSFSMGLPKICTLLDITGGHMPHVMRRLRYLRGCILAPDSFFF